MSKTTDYASRLVLSAPQLKVEAVDDIEADLEYCVAPLSATISGLYPFMIFHVRRIIENYFSANPSMSVINEKTKELVTVHPKDYQTQFSDERIRKEMERFLTGFSNRFIPIEYETVEGPIVTLRFKGYNCTIEEYQNNPKTHIKERDFTWCDLFYVAAIESVKDKCALITRYPINKSVA